MSINNPDNTKTWYLASPYSTPYERGQDRKRLCMVRHKQVEYYAKVLMSLKYVMWEPIAMSYFKSNMWEMPQEYEFWKERDRGMIDRSDGVIVCNIEGWDKSTGVTDEVEYCRSQKKPVWLVTIANEIVIKWELI